MDRLARSVGELRENVRRVLSGFGPDYWRELDRSRAFPQACFAAAASAGWFGALIPEAFGGSGAGPVVASVIVEEINRAGGDAAAINAQMSICGVLLRGGDEALCRRHLPAIASGTLRCLSVAATEPDGGADMSRLRSHAEPDGDGYRLNADKVFISMAEHTELLVLLTASDAGPCLFLRELAGKVEIRPIDTLMHRMTTTVHLEDLRVPASARLGAAGDGLKLLGGGFALRRVLAASECLGNARFLLDRSLEHARTRRTFGRVIGENQGVQYPLARAHARVEAADLMRWDALAMLESGEDAGQRSALARLLAGEAAAEAGQAALTTFGGWALASELHLERKLRENAVFGFDNLLTSYVAEHGLGLPKAF
jgi:acyl-CoA dehydrogenase